MNSNDVKLYIAILNKKMKTSNSAVPQLFLRFALGIGFLLPAMDRLGWIGKPGVQGVSWGNWENFVNYTHTLVPYLGLSLSNIAAVIATIAEFVFGIFLIIGFKQG
jgi:putative oxidoreductase